MGRRCSSSYTVNGNYEQAVNSDRRSLPDNIATSPSCGYARRGWTHRESTQWRNLLAEVEVCGGHGASKVTLWEKSRRICHKVRGKRLLIVGGTQ